MAIDDRTPNYSLQLPNENNRTTDDVGRLRAALTQIDTLLASRATQSQVTAAVNGLLGGAGAALDTLNELAAALGNDPNFATTIASSLATKLTQAQADARYLQTINAFTQTAADARYALAASALTQTAGDARYAALADAITAAERNKLAAVPREGGFTLRNRFINGGMAVDQRFNFSAATLSAGGGLAYLVDRWYGYCTGANVTAQRVLVSGKKRLRFTGAASNTLAGFGQRIEAANSFDLAGQTAVLQAKMVASVAKTVTWTAYYANTEDTFGTVASPTRTQISTGTFAVTTTEQTFAIAIVVPAAATTGIEVVFTVPSLLAGQTLTVGDFQLEKGDVTSVFEDRPMGLELALCQRYYATSAGNLEYHFVPAPGATYVTTYRVSFPQAMRAAPTFTPSYSNSNAIGTYQVLSVNSLCATHYISASAATNAYMYFSWTAAAEL